MVKYITEEVDSLKGIFHEREEGLISERDQAANSLQEAVKHREDTKAQLQDAESKAASLLAEIKVGARHVYEWQSICQAASYMLKW